MIECMDTQESCYVGRAQKLGVACRGRGANPIAHVLQAIGEPLELLRYNKWNVILPEGQFMTQVGGSQFEAVLQQVSPAAISEWRVRSSHLTSWCEF